MQFDADDADPFVLLVHHRHSFRPFDFFRPLFSAVIMPRGFPAHPHRGFETVTYVLPGRAGLTHRDSVGCKMRYGDGSVQWMTAGRGLLHEEMWDTERGTDHELYQLWLNLPPRAKLVPPRVQLLEPSAPTSQRREPPAVVEREGGTRVRRAPIREDVLDGGAVHVRTLAAGVETPPGEAPPAEGAETYSPVRIEHVELHGEGATHTMPLPDGWTCIVYVRRGAVSFGGGGGDASEPTPMYNTVYFPRHGGDCLEVRNAQAGGKSSDVLILSGEPLNAPIASSGTFVMNTEAELQRATADYQLGAFGIPWEPSLPDDEWVELCESRGPGRRRGPSV